MNGRKARPRDLIVTLDDATGAIYSAFLVEEEGTASTFRALKEVFGRHSLPMSLYTDRGAQYFRTAETGGKIDRGRLTQVGRALEQLGVEHMGTYSPQAGSRSERAFQTLQDRLPKELKPPFPTAPSMRSYACRRSGKSATTIACRTEAEAANPRKPDAPHFVRARVKVHVYSDGSHAVFYGPRCIGRYDERGALKEALRAA